MPVRLGLPSPSISIKLYGIVALFLAMVYALAAATTHFAAETESAVSGFQREGLGNVALTARVQVLLEQHRRMVATAPFASPDANTQDEGVYRELNATIAGLIDRIAPDRAEKLSQRFALLASQGSSVFELARHEHRDQAIAVGARYASAADGLTLEMLAEARRRLTDAQDSLEVVAARARSLTTWVCAAAALTGLAIGPFCLLLLHRMLARMRGIGSSLIRLARNDTSVEIPGIADADEFGQLARSVAVFKAKSIELLTKKADFERLNLQLDAAINNIPLGLSMFDAHERLLMCNRRFIDMYDVPAELTRPGTARCALREHRTMKGARHSEAGELTIDGTNLLPSMLVEFGSGRIVEVSRQPLKGGGWVSLHEDITERRRQEEKIAHLAHHDTLTGLANRMLFRERLEQSLQRLVRGQGFAVLCLDLDHFKAVNDTLGHPVGDLLLKLVGKRLLGCVRHGDIVARLGGDEFAIVQASVRDPGQTESLAARIVEAVSAPYEIDGNRIDIGTSIGITLAPRDGNDADKLMKNADLALYRSKGAGRRGFSFFEPKMHEEIQARRSLEFDLRRALGEDALELYYQPTIRLASEQTMGFEALLRWNHPERGAIPPGELLAIAEDMGLTAEIGGWSLRQACAQAARWPGPIHVAIDVSSLQFLKRNMTESVLQALAQSGLPPHRLELEIAESILHEDPNTLSILHQLRQLGVRVTLDGFGSGQCSLAGLRAFPFDKIKIDKAFIADIERSKEARAIVEATIALGSKLHMTIVAEGIEDFDQLSRLRSWGCRDGQGFLLGPPMPAGEVEGFLRARTPSAQAGARMPTNLAPLNPESAETAEPPESSRAA
jgi:diguanylate cyclase (GGDEF)-like protein